MRLIVRQCRISQLLICVLLFPLASTLQSQGNNGDGANPYRLSAFRLEKASYFAIMPVPCSVSVAKLEATVRQRVNAPQRELPVFVVARDTSRHIVILGLSTPEHAQDVQRALADLGPRQALLHREFPAPKIDGRLRDPAWRIAETMCGFTQTEPKEGLPATEDTEVRILYDDEKIYFGIVCHDSNPDGIIANDMRRDARLDDDDNIQILLDTYNDHRNAFYFQINPLGTKRDAQVTDEGKNVNDDWNCVWEVEASRAPGGWEAEIAIPFDQLRFGAGASQQWGINIGRTIRRKREETYWVPVRRDFGFRGFFRVSNAGIIRGLNGLHNSVRLEVKPYNLSGLQRDFSQEPILRENVFAGGLDVKWGITANLTADLTYKTDFAQVEADQERINLTRFSLFFPEKRDFFLEGAGIFRVGEAGGPGGGSPPEQLFYSRRIGLFEGRQVPIVAGVKTSGRLGPFNAGLLGLRTESYSFVDEEGPFSTPAADFAVVRLKRDLLQRSSLGVIALGKQERTGRYYNRTYAVDGNFAFGSNSIVAWLARTDTRGSRGRDWGGTFSYVHRSDRWTVRANYTDVQENFNDELGFIRRVDIRRSYFEVGRGLRPAIRWLRRIYTGPNMRYLTNHQNQLRNREIAYELIAFFERGHFLFAAAAAEKDVLDETWEIRDGVFIPVESYEMSRFSVRFESDRSRRISVGADVEGGGFYSGRSFTPGLSLRARPTPHITWDIDYNYFYVRLPDRVIVEMDTIFAQPATNLRSNILSTRLTYNFTTNLFAKSFTQWNDEARTLSMNFLISYIYRPGSDFYFVYNQTWENEGKRLASRDWSVLMKLTYWLNI